MNASLHSMFEPYEERYREITPYSSVVALSAGCFCALVAILPAGTLLVVILVISLTAVVYAICAQIHSYNSRRKHQPSEPPQPEKLSRLGQVFDKLGLREQKIFLREMRVMVRENEEKERKGQ